jgi:hypothetical protein
VATARHRRAASSSASSSEFTCIVKVFEPGQPGGAWKKYRKVHDLVKLRGHLERRFRYPTGWLFCNVYLKSTREQIGNFTRNGPLPPARPRGPFGNVR